MTREPASRALRPGVRLFALRAPTLPPATHTNAYLLGTGARRILVDPGADDPAALKTLFAHLDALEERGAQMTEVWLTHHHIDHHASLPMLRARGPLCCRAHRLTADALPEGTVDGLLEDGEEVTLPGPRAQTWVVTHAPGHTRGHTVFFESGDGTLLAGDHVAGVGTVIIDPPEGDMSEYLRTLDGLEALGASLLLPGHGPPTALVEARLQAYRTHRLAREAAIEAALTPTPAPLDNLVAAVYADVPAALHPFARRSLLAHLLKLEAEGRASKANGRWILPVMV